jgi:hypothetical protein
LLWSVTPLLSPSKGSYRRITTLSITCNLPGMGGMVPPCISTVPMRLHRPVIVARTKPGLPITVC